MAAPVPTTIPSRFAAGDTLLFEVSFLDYDPVTWALSYSFQKIEPDFEEIDFAAGAGTFRVNIPSSTTVNWTAGIYSGHGYVISGSERHKVWEGQVEVLTNFALNQQEDTRSNNRKTLDALRVCQLKLAAKQTSRATIEGVDLFFKDPVALEKLIAIYEVKVAAEDRRASGKQRPVILSRFTLP